MHLNKHYLLSTGLAAASLFSLLGASGCKGTNILSRDEEIRIGRQASAEIEKQYGVVRNPADVGRIERLGQRIVAANNLKWPFTFKILNNRTVNAVSLPGGPVYVFKGLYDLTEGNEDELGLIIAHEVGHIERRHVAKQYSQGVLADLAISLGTRGTVQSAAQIAAIFARMKFSRDDEYQADSSGIRFAYKAGYDPNGLIRFFQKLQRMERQGNGDIISNNLRTHPLTGARIERAKNEIAQITHAVNTEAEAAYMIGK